MKSFSKVLTIALVITLTAITGSSRANIVDFQGLGDLDGGTFNSSAQGVSSDGTTVVGYSSSAATSFEAFRWTSSEGMIGLDFLTGTSILSRGLDASSDGSIIVGSDRSSSGEQAFKWTQVGGLDGLGQLDGQTGSIAWGISDDGSIIVGTGKTDASQEAFMWTESEGMQGLGFLDGATTSFGRDISADGSTIVGNSGTDAATTQAYKWTESGGMEALGHPATLDFSVAEAVSADGSVIVGTAGDSDESTREAFLWTEPGQWQNLGDLPGGVVFAEASAVSADGSIVVGYGTTDTELSAFLWDEHNGMRELKSVLESDYGLDLTNWTLTQATGISADGLTMIGFGTNPDGFTEGWIATIPEPSIVLLLGMGSLVLLRRRKADAIDD